MEENRHTSTMRALPSMLRILIFALALLGTIKAEERPNVVIFFTDDQGTLDLGCYGSDDLHTPAIDELAATGVRFTQAYAHTVCCPARAMLLTGRHPQRSGVRHWTQGDMNGTDGINMALEELTLAEVLRAEGYVTALFGKWHLGAHRDFGPKKQGFDQFFGIRDGFIDNYNHYFLHGDKGFHDLYEGTKAVKAKGKYFPEIMIQRALKFLDEERDGEKPFLLYLPFNIPHYPEQALEKWEEYYAPGGNNPNQINDPARRSYAAMISTTDDYVGQVVKRLEKHGLRENTILVFMSDNGHSEETSYRIRGEDHLSDLPKGHFYGASGGGFTGKWTGQKGKFLEGGIRVPAIISYPKALPQGEARSQIVTAMDWYPTLLELSRIKQPEDASALDGHSLLPLIRDAKAASRYKVLHFAWGSGWAVREGDWKLIGNERQPMEKWTLHRLTGEEPERKNHAKEKPEIVRRLAGLHAAWAKDVTP